MRDKKLISEHLKKVDAILPSNYYSYGVRGAIFRLFAVLNNRQPYLLNYGMGYAV